MTDNPFLAAAGIQTPPVAPPSGGVDVAQLASAAEQKYGLPSGVLSSLVHVESHGDPKAVSSQGAEGVAQLLPATAQQLGVDPFNPAQAIDGAARYLKQGIDATGSLSGGLMYYHGGPDTKIWGPKTHAYASNVLAGMGQQPEGGDQSTDASNPFLAALNGGNQGSDAAQAQPGNNQPSANSGGQPSSDMVGGRPQPAPSVQTIPSDASGDRGGPDNGSPQLGFVQNALTNAQNLGAGIAHGFVQVPETLAGWTADAADRLGFHDRANRIRSNIAWLDSGTRQLAADPNSDRFKIGNFGGEVGATLPISEVKLLQALGYTGKLAAGLRYGDLALQGAGAGALLSRGKDVLENAGFGAAAAGLGSAAFDKVAPYALKAVESATNYKLGKAIASTIDEIRGSPEAAAEAAQPATSQRIMTGEQIAGLGEPVVQDGQVVAYRQPDGSMVMNVNITGGAKPDATIPPEALGSRGARTGIEAHNQMTPEVAQAYQSAIADGASPDEALREADVIANGGSPTASMVTRNPAMMRAEKEGAKSSSIEGQALNRAQADNNAALNASAQDIVNGYGGVPAPGEAAQTAAQSLKNAADAEYAGVNSAYEAARQQDGEAFVNPDALTQLLASKEAQAQIAGGGAEGQLLNTVGKLTDLYTDGGKQGITPDQFNSIIKTANGKYDPMGGGVNHWIGEVNSAADDGLAQFDNAGPAYKAARAKMQQFAAKYRDPQGIANLIRTDAKGNLINEDNWRTVDNMIGAKSDKPFLQIVNQLKANGDQASLNKLKATIVQDAYEHATGKNAGTAGDQLGNSIFSGSKFHARLNQIGMKKLSAVFSPEEIARLASLGRAGVAVNEAVPGTVNTSHTASTIINALKAGEAKSAHPVVKALGTALHAGAPLVGAVLHGAEGAGYGVGLDALRSGVQASWGAAAQRRAANDLAEGLRTLTSPSATRAAERAAQQKIADAARRAALARALSKQSAPVAAAASGGR